MMKKISKLALLAVAAAFLVAALPACSSGSGGEDDTTQDKDTGPKEEYTGPATTDSWNFVNNTTVFGIITGATDTNSTDKITYALSEDANIKGSEGNLTLTLQSTKVSIGSMTSGAAPNYAVQAKVEDTASVGLRFKNNSIKISDVKGKVVLEFDYTAAGNGPRNLQVTIGDDGTTKTYATSDTDTHTYTTTIDAGSGTNIYIGADNNYWVKEIKITEADETSQPPEGGDDDEEEDEEEDLSDIFTIENGYLNLVADDYEYYLSQANLEATTGNNAWSAVSDDKGWGNKKSASPFNTTTSVLAMKDARAITLKVKGVSAFRVYVQKESASDKNNRTYKVKINGSNEQTGYNNVDYNDFTTDTTGEATISIGEASADIYPVGVILYKTAPAAE